MVKPLIIWSNWFTVGFADPVFPIRCATVVELWLQQMGDFYEKPHFTMENFKFREAVKWGLKFFCTELPKGTHLRQSWSNKSFGVCGSDVILTLYGGEEKSTRESPLETMSSIITLRRQDVFCATRYEKCRYAYCKYCSLFFISGTCCVMASITLPLSEITQVKSCDLIHTVFYSVI